MSEEKKRNILQRVAIGVKDFFADMYFWFEEEFTEEVRRPLLTELGIDPDTKLTLNVSEERLLNLERYGNSVDPDVTAFLMAVEEVKIIYDAVTGYFEASMEKESTAFVEDAFHHFFRIISSNHIRVRYPFLYWFGQAVGFMEESISINTSGDSYWERFKNFFLTPGDYFSNASFKSESGTRVLSDGTLLPLGVALSFWDMFTKSLLNLANLGFDLPERKVLYGWDIIENDPNPADIVSNRALSFKLLGTTKRVGTDEEVEGSVSCTLIWISKDHGGPGLFLAFGAGGELKIPFGEGLTFILNVSSADAVDFFITGNGIDVGGPSDLHVSAAIEAEKDSGLPFYLPSSKGTRFEFGRLSVRGEGSAQDAGIKFLAEKSALVIGGNEGDGFLSKILPDQDTKIEFSFGIGVSVNRGVYLEGGSGGLQTTLPVSKSIGPLKIHSIQLGLVPKDDENEGRVDFDVGASMSLKLGPVAASVDQIGFGFHFKAPKDARNRLDWGKFDVDLGFKPPKGVGLVIDAGSVGGGGYLFFDFENERYAGVVQLEFTKFALKAIGLLTTIYKPDGSKDYSLLISISADDFTPINLGFGFTLNGVGGLLGINRSASVEALRSGLKNRTLDSVLFPVDPVRNAPQIISDLRRVFPPKSDQYVFGPVAIIGWGTPTIITAELGIIMEFPSPLRLIILGQIRALLPSAKKPLVRLNMDTLGVIDFDKGELSIDATLYDSKILQYTLSGDMALRVGWGDNPTFLLSVGGYNHRFRPPPAFPKLKRLALALSTGNNPRLRFETYLALTSNTAQIGARLEVYVKKAGFSLEGYLGFDALFQFSPFQFIVDFGGGVTVKWKGRTLLGVQLDLTLSGPSPWNAKGKATVKIWIFKKSVKFDKTFGKRQPPPTLPPADPLPELVQALSDSRNWNAQLPGAGQMFVSLRDRPNLSALLVHPRGSLTVNQRVVPLDIEISKFGNTKPSGDRRFTLTSISLSGQPAEEIRPVNDFFAPAQFIEMDDDEKLARPSFEKMQSGLRVDTNNVRYGGQATPGHMATTTMEYETCIIGAEDGSPREGETYTPSDDTVEILAQMGSVGRSVVRNSGVAKYHNPRQKVVAAEPDYVLTATKDLTLSTEIPVFGTKKFTSYTAAAQELNVYLVDHPEAKGRLQVVPRDIAEEAVSP